MGCRLWGHTELDTTEATEQQQRASLVALTVKNLPAVFETRVQSLGREDPVEKEMATRSSTLAENPMDRGAWQPSVRGVTQSQTGLKRLSTRNHR